MISVSVDLLAARRVLNAMRMMARAVRGQISSKVALKQIKDFSSLALDDIDQRLEELAQSGSEEDEAYIEQVEADLVAAGQRVLKAKPGPDLYTALTAWEGEVERLRRELRHGWEDDVSACSASVGFTEPAHKFERILPENIGLLKLAARRGASVDFVDGECEIRFSPSDLSLVAYTRG